MLTRTIWVSCLSHFAQFILGHKTNPSPATNPDRSDPKSPRPTPKRYLRLFVLFQNRKT